MHSIMNEFGNLEQFACAVMKSGHVASMLRCQARTYPLLSQDCSSVSECSMKAQLMSDIRLIKMPLLCLYQCQADAGLQAI